VQQSLCDLELASLNRFQLSPPKGGKCNLFSVFIFGCWTQFQLSPPKGGKCNLLLRLHDCQSLRISIEPAQRREVQLPDLIPGQVVFVGFQLSPPKGGKCNKRLL